MDWPRPSDETIDAWLIGTLSDEESAKVDAWFAEHPEGLQAENTVPTVLREISAEPVSPIITQLIDSLKHNPEGSSASSREDWQDVLIPTDRDDLLGMLGHYEVRDVIATGGMARVFKAWDPELKRPAALKVLAPGLATNATARERFLREARAAARLEHQNILPIYGVYDEAIPWFAMRYISGGTLQDILDAREKIDDYLGKIDRLKLIASQTASALQAAHEAGIIHRDIKPANILLDPDGERIWLCDFGIARSVSDPTLTYDGTVAGTPHYMSPEQAAGGDVDSRSDFFSLGSVLYHCATGEPPFPGKTSQHVLQKVTEASPIKVSRLNGKIPSWFEHFLGHLLAKNPGDRFANAHEIIEALESGKVAKPKKVYRHRMILGGALAALLMVVGILQIPAAKASASKALSSSLGRPFIIEGRLWPKLTLSAAIAEAEVNDTILLPSGEWDVDELRIPAGKPLTFRALDSEDRPTLTTERSGVPGLTSLSPLKLVDLNFKLNAKREGKAIVLLHHDATLRGCHFTSRYAYEKNQNLIKAAAIEIREGRELVLENCDFDCEETNIVTVSRSAKISTGLQMTARDCRIKGTFFCNLLTAYHPDHPMHVNFLNSHFEGSFFLKTSGLASSGATRVKAEDSTFALTNYLAWFRGRQTDPVQKNFTWEDRGCRYPAGKDRILIGPYGLLHKAILIRDISAYSPKDPVVSNGKIRITGLEREFTDLHQAVEQAPAGSTLFLEGNFDLKKMVNTPKDLELHFRNEPGKKASLQTTMLHDYLLYIRGKSSVRGLTFIRQGFATNSFPLLGFQNHEAKVGRCHFQASGNSVHQSGGAGIGFISCPQVSIVSSTFSVPRGIAIKIHHRYRATPKTDLVARDCFFHSASVLQRQCWTTEDELTSKFQRCIALGSSIFQEVAGKSGPLSLSAEDSLFELKGPLFEFATSTPKQIQETFSWVGLRNQYAPFESVMTSEQTTVDGGKGILESFERFLDKVPSARESDSRFAPVFDREKLTHPFTKKSLREALVQPIESPALKILEKK